MSRDFEYEVREAINDLADEARAVNLSAAAIRQGRRMVARRHALTVAAAFACVASLVIPFALLTNRDNDDERAGSRPPASAAPASAEASPPAALPAPTPTGTITPALPRQHVYAPGMSAVGVTADWIVASGSFDNGTLVYNRLLKRYTQVPYGTVIPAPRGNLAAVLAKGMLGIVDLGKPDKIRWVKSRFTVVGGVDWSSDGYRLIFAGLGADPDSVELNVLDAESVTAEPIGKPVPCVSECSPAWTPAEDKVTLTDGDGVVQSYSIKGGIPTGAILVPGPIPALHSWSPDHTMVATRVGSGTQIVRVGDPSPTVLNLTEHADGVYWVDDDAVLCVRDDGVAIYQLDGTQRALVPLPLLKASGARATTSDIILGRL